MKLFIIGLIALVVGLYALLAFLMARSKPLKYGELSIEIEEMIKNLPVNRESFYTITDAFWELLRYDINPDYTCTLYKRFRKLYMNIWALEFSSKEREKLSFLDNQICRYARAR